MDAREHRLSPRARRALSLIAAAAVVFAVASGVYLQPSPLRLKGAPPAKAAGPSVLPGDYQAVYSFLSPWLGRALVAETASATPRLSVFRTTDAARHWKRQLNRELDAIGLAPLQLRFFDSSQGFLAISDPTEIYRTSDGGAHWALVKTPNYLSLSFAAADARHGWLLGWTGPPDQTIPKLLSTSDGGDTWTALPHALGWAQTSGRFRYANITFRGPGEGWSGASVVVPTVYSSADGGASWQPHALPSKMASDLCAEPLPPGAQGPFITNVRLLPGHGVHVILSDYCGNGEGYASFDGATTWRKLASPPGTTSWWDPVYQDSSHRWTMRFGELWKSSDAGLSWKLVSQQLDDWDYLPHIIDANHAWAELISREPGPGMGGLALTSDGGLHWSHVNAPQPA